VIDEHGQIPFRRERLMATGPLPDGESSSARLHRIEDAPPRFGVDKIDAAGPSSADTDRVLPDRVSPRSST